MDQFKKTVESTLAWGSPWDKSGMGVSVGATLVMVAHAQWLTTAGSCGPEPGYWAAKRGGY